MMGLIVRGASRLAEMITEKLTTKWSSAKDF